jgi:UPF0716 protein FxsA
MKIAGSLLRFLLFLPLMELVVFITIALAIGFGAALGLILLSCIAGMLLLRHAGGSHISRLRVAMAEGNFSTLQADATGGMILLSGVLLVIPGFITDALGLALLFPPLRRAVLGLVGLRPGAARADDGVVDLDPAQWHRVPDRELPDRRDDRDSR